jgi:cytochrome c biogenesis protein CcdA
MINFILGIAIIIGILVAPFMTVGAIMYHFGHETMGVILAIIGIIHMIIKGLSD